MPKACNSRISGIWVVKGKDPVSSSQMVSPYWPPTHDEEAFPIPPQVEYYEKSTGFGVHLTWFGNITLAFTSCVMLGSLPNLTESTFTSSKWRISPISWIGYDYRMENAVFRKSI